MKKIILPCGSIVKVDDNDYEDLIKYKWYGIKASDNRGRYAIRYVKTGKGKTDRRK